MSHEPKIDDVVLPDGRRWQHLNTFGARYEVAEELGLPFEQLGTFLNFDPHETGAYLALRRADGRTQCVASVEVGELTGVQAHYGRPGTPEEWVLAREVAPVFGREIMREAGFVVEDEPEGLKI